MQTNNHHYDVAIMGSGIAGSTLAAILARQGLKVILFEANSHPRFAIGESMILETSEMMRAMAQFYEVPELAYFSSENYFEHIGTSHGVKRHFSYAHHTQGQPFDPSHILQAVIPKQPHGHELHLYRQDTDYCLMMVAIRYGATVLEKTPIQSVHIDADGVQLTTDQEQLFSAEYVVDAGGFRSLLAQTYNLRHHDLQTHSRAIFTHMLEVPCYHQVQSPREAVPFQLSEGTLHHVFAGGWLWVIPFNNHRMSTNPLCSVGLMLDPRTYPLNADVSPETEFYQFIERFPGIAAQFRNAKPVRDWTRTGRIQYSSTQVVGDRYCLLGQAAGFVDPLFSKGLYTALACTSVLADRLLAAQESRDYSKANFQPLEDMTLAFIKANDQLVAHAYRSFSDYQLWAPFSVLWLLGAYLELVKLTSSRALATDRQAYYRELTKLSLVGGRFPEFNQISAQIFSVLDRLSLDNQQDIAQTSQSIQKQLNQVTWLPQTFRAILQGKNHLPSQKLHPRLLRFQNGFLGIGSYRRHFFGTKSLRFFIGFYLQERGKFSLPRLRLQRATQLRQQGLLPLRKWRQTVAASGLIATSWFLGFGCGEMNPVSKFVAQSNPSITKTRGGVVSFLHAPTSFQFVCGNHTGQISGASVEGNRLIIRVNYPKQARPQRATLMGQLDNHGVVNGTYRTQFSQRSFSGQMRLSFAEDGTAQGINKDWGGSIQILKR